VKHYLVCSSSIMALHLFVLITLWRALNPALIGWAATPRRVLIIGTDWAAETIIKTLRQHAPASYQISGIIGGEQDVGLMIADVPVFGCGRRCP
jgi:FlaA1/EpsC-like NDP-sugar epimerase